MGKITVQSNIDGIQGLTVIIPKMFEDNRGYLTETFNHSEMVEAGILSVFVQDNEAFSKKGVLRGFHVNRNHPQAKLVRVLDGEIYDVDLRKGSFTYKKWYGIRLSSDNRKQLYIPEGFGHAYQAVTDARIIFKVTTHWIAGDEAGFAWNSEEFDIDWPIKNPIQNDSDRNSPDFSEAKI